ncbi:GDP-fucose transporter 1-like [Pecten maximus]|uniref:GDP-fucose transporter 1-like n=1 Tax=Pecten maximus TaxID=6579 RepID=UPI001458247B|nr:GDP-fucose transporter 1-like [Pecten maximus]
METQRSTQQIALVIALYWIVSISMVFINKHILSGSYGINDLSIFVAWYQSLSAVFLIKLVTWLSGHLRLGLTLPSLDIHALLNSDMLKLSFAFVIGLTFNNLMLKHIGVAFYQVARSFTLIFTIILSFCVLKKYVPILGIASCALVIMGFVIGIDQEDNAGTLSIWGMIYGIFASLANAVCGIYFKRVEMVLDGDSLKQAYYNNVNSIWIFLPLVISSGQAQQVLSSDLMTNASFWMFLTFSGFLSLSIGWVSALQVKYTSPVTHHISINAKSVAQTMLAIMFYHEYKTLMWWCGNLLVILGIFLYAYTKMNESQPSSNVVNGSRKQLPVYTDISIQKTNAN